MKDCSSGVGIVLGRVCVVGGLGGGGGEQDCLKVALVLAADALGEGRYSGR